MDTFERKFRGEHYLQELVSELVDPGQAGDLRVVVALLRRLPRPPVAGSTVAFGDLKPEHILLGVDGQPMYLDPGVLAASASADAARLVCRLLLWLWSRLPTPEVRAAITDGLEAFVADRLAARAAFTNRRQLDVRMAGTAANATIVHTLALELAGYPGAVLGVTNPVDLLARLVAETSACHRVYGIGANLDTARYRTLLAAACGVAVEVVDGHVIGEHGDAAVCCLSATTIQGHPLDSDATPPGELYAALHARPGLITRGIGRVRAGAVGAILSALGKVLGETDGVEHLSVRCRHHGWLGLPVRFTRGAAQPFLPPLNPDEQRRLAVAADKLHHAYQTLLATTLGETVHPPRSTRETR